jgi:uncharacterized protein (TIGR03435 family)
MPFLPMMDPGHISLRARSILEIICMAYSIDWIEVSGPTWLSEKMFDIDAKLPDGSPPALANEMLRTLLVERFGLKAHSEVKDVNGFALVVGKDGPKLKVAVGQDIRSDENAFKRLVAFTQAARQHGARTLTCLGCTSGAIAKALSRQIQEPVVDETSLTQRYDVLVEIPNDPGYPYRRRCRPLG